jgi:hypothetical protein
MRQLEDAPLGRTRHIRRRVVSSTYQVHPKDETPLGRMLDGQSP